jgi:uncharacterized membrane protein
MIDDEVKYLAIGLIIIMMGVTVYPVLSEQKLVEPFSELGILGPNGKLGDYPHQVNPGEEIKLQLYVGNEEGSTQYYRVDVKSGLKEQNVSDIVPLQAPKIATYELVLPNMANSTTPISFSLAEAGLNRRVIFELYRYDVNSGNFKYQIWTQIWLNVTSP